MFGKPEAYAGVLLLISAVLVKWWQSRARSEGVWDPHWAIPTRVLAFLGTVFLVHAAIWWRYG